MFPDMRSATIFTRRSGHVQTFLYAVALAWFYLCAASQAAAGTTTTTALAVTSGGAAVTSVPSGSAVTLTATVTAGATPVTPGEVNFCDATASYCTDIHLLGTAQLTAAGTATLKFVPGPGSHTYYAAFKGTTIYAGSVSANVPLTVLAATGPVKTTVGIQASGGQGDYALLGTVATNGPASPTGNLSFLDTTNSNYVLGTATLGPTGSNGISFLNTTTFPLPRENNIVGAGVIATGDFNGDGIADLLVDDAATDTIYILLGNGDGTFTTSSIAVPATLSVGEIVTGDFNGDGKLDFAVSFHSGIAIYLGNGDGTFTAGQTISLAKYANAGTGGFVAADFNGDGILDLAQAFSVAAPGGTGGDCVAGYENCTIQIYLGNGDGTFNALSTSTPSGSVAEMVAADFNGDGKPDLAAATIGDEYVEVLLGNGDGTFTAAPHVLTNEQSIALAAADLNGDGNTDLVVETQYPQSSANILLGNGDGTFNVLPSDPNLAQQTQAVAIGDFNGDGIPDLVQPNENGGYTSVFLGKGDGTFVPDAFSPSVADFIFTSIAVTDFNGDGQSDIAEVSWNNGTSNTLPDQLDVLLAQSPSTAAGYLYNVSPVGTGLHYVDASYPGDSNNAPGVSPAIALEAEQVTTTLGLAASPSPSPLGQTVTLTATLSPFLAQDHYASGNVTFTSNGKTIGTAPLSNGVATLMTSTLPLGTNNLVAKYPGDTNFTSSISSLVPLTISAALTGLSLSSSANPTTANAPITFTLQLTFNSQPAPAGQSLTLTYNPTGTAQIVVPLLTDANGTATFSLPGGLPIGSYLFTASFAGTASQSAASANLTEQVLAPSPTTTQLTCAPSTIPAAGTALLTALVTATSGTPTGSVSFTDNGTALGSSPLSNANGATGSATWNYTPIIAGTHTLTANYSPGIGFVASSATCTETVTLLPTTSTLSIGLTSSPIGSIFQFTATVAPVTPLANPKPTGTVSFYESFPPPAAVALLGTVPLGANGTATLALNKLSSGTDTFYCIYSGDATFAPSQCPPLIKVINAGTTVLSLTSSANPAGPGAPITYTMQLAFSGQAAPAGQSISLAYSPTGTAPIIVPLLTDANGAATYTLAQGLPVGSYLFAATFAATSSQSAATNTLTQVVSASLTGPPDFTLTGPSTITFLTTTTNATPLTIASVGGFTANIALTCSATIPQYVCSVAPGSVPLPANGSAVVTLTLHFVGLAQADRGRAPLTTGERAMLAAMAPLSLLGLLGVRRRRLRWLLGLLCLTVLTTAISACGTDAYPTIFGTYPVTVTGAGTNAGASAPTTHTLNVTTNIIQ